MRKSQRGRVGISFLSKRTGRLVVMMKGRACPAGVTEAGVCEQEGRGLAGRGR